MTYEFILTKEADGIAIITLNRSQKYNAMHGPLIKELLQALKNFAEKRIRVLMITAEGKHFCAGADIGWMQQMGEKDFAANVEDTQMLADLLYELYSFPAPTLVLAQGLVLGGGLGLLSACDIALATKDAQFQFPEVRIGLTPSIVSPYVISCIGKKRALFYFLTGFRFDAERAKEIGLIQQITKNDSLLNDGMMIAETLLANGQAALLSAKTLVSKMAAETEITKALSRETALHLAHLRSTKEAQEGFLAFLEKRTPKW